MPRREYRIVSAVNPDIVSDVVNMLIASGHVPYGHMFYSSACGYTQIMITVKLAKQIADPHIEVWESEGETG